MMSILLECREEKRKLELVGSCPNINPFIDSIGPFGWEFVQNAMISLFHKKCVRVWLTACWIDQVSDDGY